MNQTNQKYQTNPIFQLGPTNQTSPNFQANTALIDSIYHANQTFQNNQILPKEPTKNIIPQQINYSNINQIAPKNYPENIVQNNNQAVNQVNNNVIRIQEPKV